MNLDDKLNLFHGSCGGYVGNVCGNSRLNIPAIKMNDGPQGFRGKAGTSTAMPSGLTIGASFDVEAAGLCGTTMGEEFFNKGSNVQLGPGLCVARVPRNGRGAADASRPRSTRATLNGSEPAASTSASRPGR